MIRIVCPNCGSDNTIEIVHGEAMYGPEISEREKRGEVMLGGCVIYGNSPNRYCKDCHERFIH